MLSSLLKKTLRISVLNIDKIPTKTMTYSPGDESYHLGTITISKGEYANSEKINDVIEWCRDLQTRLEVIENK